MNKKDHLIHAISQVLRNAGGEDNIACISLVAHNEVVALILRSTNQEIARAMAHAMIEDQELYLIIMEAMQIYQMDVMRRTQQN